MKLSNIKQVDRFLKAVRACNGDVWLESSSGDRLNLSSKMSQYVAMGALLSDNGNDLDLYCSLTEDESNFIEFFYEYPETLE